MAVPAARDAKETLSSKGSGPNADHSGVDLDPWRLVSSRHQDVERHDQDYRLAGS